MDTPDSEADDAVGEETPADDMVRRMVSGELEFPYKSRYLPPPDAFFDKLCSYTYVNVSDAPYIARMRAASGRGRRGPNSVRAGIAQTPWGFDRKEISLVVNDSAFDDVDLITDHFTEEARMAANIRGSPSPLEAWRDPVIARKIALNALTRARRAKVAAPTLYMMREACYDNVPECTLFKVSLAAGIYNFFLADKIRVGSARVLDPFAGWGDRALGAAGAGVSKYVGVDPNSALVSGHQRIKEFVGRTAPEVEMLFRPIPFEEYGPADLAADFPSGADLVFSSPPFHDYELYSADASQSTRFTTLIEWLRDWFFPVTDRAWGALAPGGCLAYYLTDANGEVTGPLCDHMEAHGRHFRGVVACRRGEKRPLPLWVWQKDELGPVVVPPPAVRVPAPTQPPGDLAAQGLDGYVADLLDDIYDEIGS